MGKLRFTRINYALAAAVLALTALAVSVRFAQGERQTPLRCPPGLVALEARCCGEGQGLGSALDCTGDAVTCAASMQRDDRGACQLPDLRVLVSAGTTHFAAADWEGPDEPPRDVVVDDFYLDRAEVSVDRYSACIAAEACPKITSDREHGRPVRNVSPEEAASFCTFAGGRLPTAAEWVFAAAGPGGRRYPWGNTGLVCRRASFGLSRGPCARGGDGPDLRGSRPDGATPEGILDLSGNVAEWTRERDGGFAARGGSYGSEVAGDLKTWAVEPRATRAPHVGFRCAYDEARRVEP